MSTPTIDLEHGSDHIEVGFFEANADQLIVRVKPTRFEFKRNHDERFYSVAEKNELVKTTKPNLHERFLALPFQRKYLAKSHKKNNQYKLKINKATNALTQLNNKQKSHETFKQQHPIRSFFFVDILSDFGHSTMTTRQKGLVWIGFILTFIYALAAFMGGTAGLALLLDGLFTLMAVSIPFWSCLLIGALIFGIVAGLVNYRMMLVISIQMMLDILGGEEEDKPISQYFTQNELGEQMPASRQLLLFLAGLFTIISTAALAAMWFYLMMEVATLLAIPQLVAFGILIPLVFFQSIANGLFVLKFAQMVMADPDISSPIEKLTQVFNELDYQIRDHIQTGIESDMKNNSPGYNNEQLRTEVDTQATQVKASIIIISSLFFLALAISSGATMFIMAQTGVKFLSAYLLLSPAGMIGVQAGVWSFMGMIFIVDLMFLLKNAFMTASECTNAYLESRAHDKPSHFQGSEAVYLLMRCFNAVAQGLIGITPILVAFVAGAPISSMLIAMSVISVTGRLLISFSLGTNGQAERHIISHRLVYDGDDQPLTSRDEPVTGDASAAPGVSTEMEPLMANSSKVFRFDIKVVSSKQVSDQANSTELNLLLT